MKKRDVPQLFCIELRMADKSKYFDTSDAISRLVHVADFRLYWSPCFVSEIFSQKYTKTTDIYDLFKKSTRVELSIIQFFVWKILFSIVYKSILYENALSLSNLEWALLFADKIIHKYGFDKHCGHQVFAISRTDWNLVVGWDHQNRFCAVICTSRAN